MIMLVFYFSKRAKQPSQWPYLSIMRRQLESIRGHFHITCQDTNSGLSNEEYEGQEKNISYNQYVPCSSITLLNAEPDNQTQSLTVPSKIVRQVSRMKWRR
ncbi:hypothetical protein PanWU01x14_118370 [Parasponia andersonii]|uniref:Uncharacterized protein n=1 Tax=Parasponia andersonii TaxID=3476 RepID=A0A2P5CVX3_PARAD|nr:hypothetical protein PanWU01x14_118370 [Parasponia andersonii]